MKCRICNNSHGNEQYEVREMHYGFRDFFIYFQCSACECLQIAALPDDMPEYYPSDYGSFLLTTEQRYKNPIKRIFKILRDRYVIYKKGVFERFLYACFPSDFFHVLSPLQIQKKSTILDVGCGSGSILHALMETGHKYLTGADPYIKEDIEYQNGLKIYKKSIHELDGRWDIIMFHHSFEHIPDPIDTLHTVSRLLTERGQCLIRIPTVSSHAWQHYRENWVQIDAPRHFFLHSTESIAVLAEKADLTVAQTVYDSTEFQFWGSEQYVRDIPLKDPRSYGVNPSNSIFSVQEIAEFKQRAKELNLNNKGDSCAILLRKS